MACRKTYLISLLVVALVAAALACLTGCTGTSSVENRESQSAGNEVSAPAQAASAADSSSQTASSASASSAAITQGSDESSARSQSSAAASVVDDIEIEAIAQFVAAYNKVSASPIERTWRTGRSSYAGETYGYILNISDANSQTCVRIGNNAEFSGMVDPFADVVKAFDQGESDEARDLFNQAMALFETSKEDVTGNVGNLKVTFSIMNEVERGHIQIYHFK